MKSSVGRFQEWLSDWDEGKTRQVITTVLAVLCGLLFGLVVYTISKYVLNQVFSFPPGLYYMKDEAQREALLNTVAGQVFIVIPITWAVGCFAGGYIAVRMAKLGQFPSWITGILLTAYYLIDLISIPHNTLLFLLCPVLVGLCAWGAGWVGMYVTVQKEMKAEAAARAQSEAEAEA